ncbi:MAG: hypothetical protein ACJ789_09825 [Thermomicrobiales bacterium]
MSRQPHRPAEDDLKFPNPFADGGQSTPEQVRGSLPVLPSVGLGPEEPEEARDPAWDPLSSSRDDLDLPDKPLTWQRRFTWPAIAILCGLLLLVIAFTLID